MLGSIWDDVKQQYNYGNMVTRIIIVNMAIFIFVNLLFVIMEHGSGGALADTYKTIIKYFCMSSDIMEVIFRPWTIFTSMFLHEGFFHVLWNMLFLFWFGRIVGGLIGDHHILPIYLLGGVAGCIAFFLSVNFLPYGGDGVHYALGASAGVMAIVAGSGFLAPDYLIHLPFIGSVKLKFIVAFLIFVDLVGTAHDINTGGHFAHLGGALLGWYYITQLREGFDLSEPINKLLGRITAFFRSISDRFQGKRPRPRVVYRNKEKKRSFNTRPHAASDTEVSKSHQEELDAILEEIKKDGYESLSEEEKEFLFNASKK